MQLKMQFVPQLVVYNSTVLSKFGSVFVLSKLQDSVDNVDINSIRGSETIIRLQKRFEPNFKYC
jgi:hypothetical protein